MGLNIRERERERREREREKEEEGQSTRGGESGGVGGREKSKSASKHPI